MSNDLPARWRDDAEAPTELRELGEVLETFNEPAPAGARARVWAGVEQQPPRRVVPRLAWAGAAAVLLVAVVLGPRLLRPNDVGHVEALIGSGILQNGAAMHMGHAIQAGTSLTTTDGRAVVRLDGGVTYLAAATTAAIGVDEVVLERGTVVSSVEPRGDAPPFRVVAGDFEVRVLGTLFQVTRDERHVEVRVRKGRVEVRGPKTRTLVGAGESFSSRGEVVDAISTEAVTLLGGHEPISMVPTPERSLKPEPTVVAPRVRPRPAPPAAPQPGPVVETEPEPSPAETTEPVPEETPAEPAPEDALAGELGAYRAAMSARARDLNEAIRLFEDQLSTYPTGVMAQEARTNVIEGAMQLGKHEKAKFHLDVFLAAYPTSERAKEMHFLRAEIARQNHDCASAIPDYDAALDSSRRAGDALYYKSWCLLRHEKTTEALPLLERYLERFPTGRHAGEAEKRVTEIRALDR